MHHRRKLRIYTDLTLRKHSTNSIFLFFFLFTRIYITGFFGESYNISAFFFEQFAIDHFMLIDVQWFRFTVQQVLPVRRLEFFFTFFSFLFFSKISRYDVSLRDTRASSISTKLTDPSWMYSQREMIFSRLDGVQMGNDGRRSGLNSNFVAGMPEGEMRAWLEAAKRGHRSEHNRGRDPFVDRADPLSIIRGNFAKKGMSLHRNRSCTLSTGHEPFPCEQFFVFFFFFSCSDALLAKWEIFAN